MTTTASLSNNSTVNKLSLLFFLSLIFISLQILSDGNSLLNFSYWLIPDSVTNFELTFKFVNGEFTLGDFGGSAGVQLYYSIFFHAGIAGFILANIILLSVGVKKFGLTALYVPLLFYPHYLQLIILPSKDMMVLAIYFFVFFLLLNRYFLMAIFISALSYFIRDGAMYVLLPMVIVALLVYKTNLKPIYIVVTSFFVGVITFFVLASFAEEFHFFALTRNSASLLTLSSDQFRNLPLEFAYIGRVFFNLTNMAFRLPYFDNLGMVSVASIFFYISGISSLVCCGISIRNIFKSTDKGTLFVSTCYFVSLFVISLNPFVQGRYQLPIAVICSVVFFRTLKTRLIFKIYIVAIAISLVGRFVYISLNIPFPELEASSVDLLTLVDI